MTRKIRAFTFIELLITLVVLGVAMFPIMNMFISGKRGTKDIMIEARANSLAQEKLEMLRLIPISRLKSDVDIFQRCFADTFVDEFKDIHQDRQLFDKLFTDIYTTSFSSGYAKLYSKLAAKWKEVYGWDYEPYPESYGDYRRITRITDFEPDQDAKGLYKVSVSVYHKKEGAEEELMCELNSLFADR